MFSRNVQSPWSRISVVLAIAVACAGSAGCKLLNKKKRPHSSASTSTATTEGAALTGVPVPTIDTPAGTVDTPAADLGPVDPLSAPDRALFVQTTNAVHDVEAMVKKGLLTNPAKTGEGDANTQCATVESARPHLETLPDADGELKKLLGETKRLCSLEVPILNCNSALQQASHSPSQASKRLMCGLAQKDFDKARTAKPLDRRIFDLGQRLSTTCK